MAGKRASMREGPLAALFRKTETEGLEDAPGTSVVEESHAPKKKNSPTSSSTATIRTASTAARTAASRCATMPSCSRPCASSATTPSR